MRTKSPETQIPFQSKTGQPGYPDHQALPFSFSLSLILSNQERHQYAHLTRAQQSHSIFVIASNTNPMKAALPKLFKKIRLKTLVSTLSDKM